MLLVDFHPVPGGRVSTGGHRGGWYNRGVGVGILLLLLFGGKDGCRAEYINLRAK